MWMCFEALLIDLGKILTGSFLQKTYDDDDNALCFDVDDVATRKSTYDTNVLLDL